MPSESAMFSVLRFPIESQEPRENIAKLQANKAIPCCSDGLFGSVAGDVEGSAPATNIVIPQRIHGGAMPVALQLPGHSLRSPPSSRTWVHTHRSSRRTPSILVHHLQCVCNLDHGYTRQVTRGAVRCREGWCFEAVKV